MTAALLLQGGVAVAQSETDSTITVGPDVMDGIPVDTLVKLSPEEQQKNAEDAMKKFAERLKAIKEAHKKKSDSQQSTDDSQQSEADTLGLPTGRAHGHAASTPQTSSAKARQFGAPQAPQSIPGSVFFIC